MWGTKFIPFWNNSILSIKAIIRKQGSVHRTSKSQYRYFWNSELKYCCTMSCSDWNNLLHDSLSSNKYSKFLFKPVGRNEFIVIPCQLLKKLPANLFLCFLCQSWNLSWLELTFLCKSMVIAGVKNKTPLNWKLLKPFFIVTICSGS